MKKILIVITTGFASYGGLTTVMMNYYRAMKKSELLIDFASANEIDDELHSELKKSNSNYYCLGNRKKNIVKYVANLRKLMKVKKYDVIHVNGNSSTMVMELLVAKHCKVISRIAHVHQTRSGYPLLNSILYPVFKKTYTKAIAVSKQAGEWLFKDNFVVLNNAIDTDKYKYDEAQKGESRRIFQVKDKFVIGNVGKLNAQKNHAYLLRVFAEYRKLDINSVLLIAGGGELEHQLKDEAKILNMADNVIFLGMCSDVKSVLSCFDVFVFPSVFEGLGLALIEAQASGLNCIAADTIPKETKVSDNVEYLSLSVEPRVWAEKIYKIKQSQSSRNEKSGKACEDIKANGYDISQEAWRLEKIYIDS